MLDFIEVGRSSDKNVGEVARKDQWQAGETSAGRREQTPRGRARRGRQQQLYNRWDEHVSCSALTSVGASPGRIHFGGRGPE